MHLRISYIQPALYNKYVSSSLFPTSFKSVYWKKIWIWATSAESLNEFPLFYCPHLVVCSTSCDWHQSAENCCCLSLNSCRKIHFWPHPDLTDDKTICIGQLMKKHQLRLCWWEDTTVQQNQSFFILNANFLVCHSSAIALAQMKALIFVYAVETRSLL